MIAECTRQFVILGYEFTFVSILGRGKKDDASTNAQRYFPFCDRPAKSAKIEALPKKPKASSEAAGPASLLAQVVGGLVLLGLGRARSRPDRLHGAENAGLSNK